MHSVGFRIDNSLEYEYDKSVMPSGSVDVKNNSTLLSQRPLDKLDATVEAPLQDSAHRVWQLMKEVERLTRMLVQTQETSQLEIRRLESELSKRDQRMAEMAQMLAKRKDYEEIKRELLVLRKRNGSEPTASVQRKSKLLEKNQFLQNELNQVKTLNQQLKNVILLAQSISGNSFGIDAECKDLLKGLMHDPRTLIAESDKLAAAVALNSPLDLSSHQPRANSVLSTQPSKSSMMDENANSQCSPLISSPSHINNSILPGGPTIVLTNSAVAPPLDTLLVAQNVRELLAANNIGQRLFAKHVLGLSQGTVSELLSKPKTWDKLTEKGRESYRKMNCWTEEPQNITQLKSIAPKKGQIFVTPAAVSSHENHVTEERVNQILQEAKVAMGGVKSDSQEEPQDMMLNGEKIEQIYFREAACLTRETSSDNSQLFDSSNQLEQITEQESEALDDGHIPQCVMQPISREQFNKYSCLNTEDVVKRVKEILNRYTISQRLFGEYVLGLSQGSVSDLLARPKPWRQLTQKGHEPFIRMQIFIDDPNSISKLLAGVYSKVSLNKDTQVTCLESFVEPAQTDEIDTLLLSKRISQVLAHSGVTEALFGDIVLGGVSSCQLEELLTCPMPWSQLTPKIRALYARMHHWLSSCSVVDSNMSNTNAAAMPVSKPTTTKRTNSASLDETMSAVLTETNVNNDAALKNINYSGNTHDMSSKKSRVVFTEHQKRSLLMSYSVENYPRPEVLEQLSVNLELPVKTIVNWFHNHRMRCKLSTSNVASSMSHSEVCPASSATSISTPAALDDALRREVKPACENDTQVVSLTNNSTAHNGIVQVNISSRRKKSKPTRLIKVDPDIENMFSIPCL